MGSPIEPSKLTRRSVLISAAGSASLVAGMTRWPIASKPLRSAVSTKRRPRRGRRGPASRLDRTEGGRRQ